MSHSRWFDALRQSLRLARYCDDNGLSAKRAMERRADLGELLRKKMGRRAFAGGLGAAAAGAALGLRTGSARAANVQTNARIAILGGGLAGLACADRLRSRGVVATIYEANASRVGGRCYSFRGFPGQVAENGGELIDNQHKLMLGYAQELGLAKEDLSKEPGEIAYYFGGQHRTEAELVDELRVLVHRMRPDLQSLSAQPDYYSHTPADVALDQTSLEEYLDAKASDLPLARGVMTQAYIAEYGREPSEQSCLNLLLFFHLDRRSKFSPFGSSDERYHLVGGNDAVATGIADRLPGPVLQGARVTKIRKNAFDEFAITLSGSSTEVLADAVVVALPFSVLRTITLDPNLGLSAPKLAAIQQLGYGHNAKTMIRFDSRPWFDFYGSNGSAYSDLPNVQNTWETNAAAAAASGHAILTDYSGGARGFDLQVVNGGAPGYCGSCHIGNPSAKVINDTLIQAQVDAFLTDLDTVYPGAKAAASRSGGEYMVQRAHWYPQSMSRGSYTCYLPGQFTSIAGLEGESAGLLKFAGEHANSFYMYQGFMEGAVMSGIDAADALLDDIKDGLL